MSKLFLILCVALCTACHCAMAQEASSTPRAPRPPFFAEPPINAAWKVTVAPLKAAQSPTPANAQKAIRQIEIIKVDKTRRTVVSYSDGAKIEMWFFDGLDIFPASDGSLLVLDPRNNDLAPSFEGYDHFGAFQWLDAPFFVGTVTIGDRVCNHFKRSTNNGDQEAWVDANTKLPVCLVEGNTRKLYTFGDPPIAPLQMPPGYQSAFDAYMKPAREAIRFKMIP